MSHDTYEFHRVRAKRFPSQWYVRCKPCTYLASKLALSPNGPKRASTWASSPRSTIWRVQIDFWAYGTFGAKSCTYLAPTLTLSLNGPKRDSTWATPPTSSIWHIRCKSCTYLVSRLALYPNRPKRASTWALSPRRTIECIKIIFMFSANRAPILHWQ
jgi:hypothetical protein